MKRCRQCKSRFDPWNSLQVVCSPSCAAEWAKTEPARAATRRAMAKERREYRVARETVPQATRKAQAAFNAWVRARDNGKPCISCGTMPSPKRGGTMDAGHYRSTGACPQLRLEPLNCHLQCVRCNRDLSGNTVAYRFGLIDRIGIEAVEWLERDHPLPKWTVSDLRELAAKYRAMTRDLEKQRSEPCQPSPAPTVSARSHRPSSTGKVEPSGSPANAVTA